MRETKHTRFLFFRVFSFCPKSRFCLLFTILVFGVANKVFILVLNLVFVMVRIEVGVCKTHAARQGLTGSRTLYVNFQVN